MKKERPLALYLFRSHGRKSFIGLVGMMIVFCFNACTEPDSDPDSFIHIPVLKADLETGLPRITSTGNNTAGCILDGRLFNIDDDSWFGGPNYHYSVYKDSIAVIRLMEGVTGTEYNERDLTLVFDLKEGGPVYSLFQPDASSYETTFTRPTGDSTHIEYFHPREISDGWIKLIRNDEAVIAGTFAVKLFSSRQNMVLVTSGRFDLSRK